MTDEAQGLTAAGRLRRVIEVAKAPQRLRSRRPMTAELAGYAGSRTSPLPPFVDAVQRRTHADSDDAYMMVSSEQAQLLACLVHATAARQVLEIGTFTGYSTLAMARALPPGGTVITCELDEDSARAAQQHFSASPLADRIRLEVGPALDTLARLDGPFDLVLIDADKIGYLRYFEAVLPKLSDHGLIVADNTLHLGLAKGPEPDSAEVLAIEAFNIVIAQDDRVEQVVLPLWDGMTVIRPVTRS